MPDYFGSRYPLRSRPAAGAFATITKVQDTGIQTGSDVADDSVAFGANVTAGNMLTVAVAAWHTTSYTTNDCTDSLSNNYVIAGAEQTHYFTDAGVSLWYVTNTAGGACTVTVDPTQASGNYLAWSCAEFSGIATSGAIDQTAQNTAVNTATDANVTTAATTQADELVLAVAEVAIESDIDVAWGAAATTGYTNIAQYPDWGGIVSISFDYKIVSATGTQSANWSHDPCTGGSGGNSWGCVIATFKAAAL
jgi:hypothetical protein